MNKKYNFAFVLGIMYIAMFVGIAIASVNQISCIDNEPYGWTIIISILGLTLTPFLCGYYAGKE